MDSLTQIALGAAVGELVLGKKLGNKAIFWGAIGGTIPDLDIIGNAFMSEVDALAFHRGISHSFFFALFASFPLAWFLQWWYKQSFREHKVFKWFKWSSTLLVYVGLVLGIYSMINVFKADYPWLILVLGLMIGYLLFKRYYLNEINPVDPGYNVSFKQGYLLFFWTIFTHIILDVFTAYGTQIFMPFSDYRAAIASISVVDPVYTIPLLSMVISASFLNKQSSRKLLVWIGLGISTSYLLFTIWNKDRVSNIFDHTLSTNAIEATRTYVTPYILNNVLWHCVAEIGDEYIVCAYSIFDKHKIVEEVARVNKNELLLDGLATHPDIKILKWFSDGYYSVMRMDEKTLYLGDLRYGNTHSDFKRPEDFIFVFKIDQSYNPLNISSIRNRDGDISDMLGTLWNRIKGI